MEENNPFIAEILFQFMALALSRNVGREGAFLPTLRDRERARPGIPNFLFKPNLKIF